MTETVVLMAVDREHLVSALEAGLGTERPVTFGTDFWTEDARARPESFPTGVPIFIFEVARGLTESVPVARWRGTFLGYRRGEDYAPAELAATRPPTALARQSAEDENEREPEWLGYLVVVDLERLSDDAWVRLG